MPWSEPALAVVLGASPGAEVRPLPATSTSSIVVQGPGGAPVLRIFGVEQGPPPPGSHEPPARAPQPPDCPNLGGAPARIPFVDAAGEGPIRMGPDGEARPVATCIPRWRPSQKLRGRKGESAQRWHVVYKDSDVVELPDGRGWLMLTVRTRAPAKKGAPEPKQPPWKDLGPAVSRSDIVAWWSSRPDFRGPEVAGPFLIAHDEDALPGVHAPAWLGVPSGRLDEGGKNLLVYFVTEPEGGPKEHGEVPRGIAVRKIALESLDRSLGRRPKAERRWKVSDAIPGENLGPVRLWEVDQGGALRPAGQGISSWGVSVDPETVSCPGADELWFAVIPRRQPGVPQAPWRAVAIEAGQTLPVGAAEEGRDWRVLERLDGLGADAAAAHPYIDPDVVHLSDGRWWAFSGTADRSGLWRWDGDAGAVCAGE